MTPFLLATLAAVVVTGLIWWYVRAAATPPRRLQLVLGMAGMGAAVASLAAAGHVLLGVPRSLTWLVPATACLLLGGLAAGVAPRVLARADRFFLVAFRAFAVSLFVAALLVLFVAGLGGIPKPEHRAPLALALLAALSIAVLALPFWKRVVTLSHALTYGDHPSPAEISGELAARLTRAAPAEETLLQFAEALHGGLRLSSIQIWTRRDHTMSLAISLPHLPAGEIEADPSSLEVLGRLGVTGHAWLEVWLPALAEDRGRNLRVAPATHAGEVLAIVLLERDRTDDLFTRSDEDLVTDLARRLGSLLHGQRLDHALQETLRNLHRHAAELQASRARIVAAADDERRRLERDIHDSAQQRLVALSVQLRFAAEVLMDDPGEARAMLEELVDQAREATAELRALAHGIYPPVLESSGLAGALPIAAARSAISAEVEVGEVGRYPRDVEAAIYFCCLEALQNAAKHAGSDANAIIRLYEEGGWINFEVKDDGVGFDAGGAEGGRGFTNMSDRLGAIGGSLEVDSGPGKGTRVTGRVPLEERPAV